MEDVKMENSEIICVEVQENENGDIIYVEKIDTDDYVVMDDDFCVVECEIATSGENTNFTSPVVCTESSNSNEPVEIIFLRNFDEDGDGNPIILKQEIEASESDFTDENSESMNQTTVKDIKTYVKKHNFMKLEDKCMKLQTPIKKHTTSKTVAQTQKLNALLQVASGKVNQMSKPHSSIQEVKGSVINPNVPVRRLSAFSQQRPKLWSHRVDRRNFDNDNLLSNITNITSQKENQVCAQQDSNISGCDVQTEAKRKILPYPCEMCDKSFRQASSLVIHLKVHAGKYTDNCVIS